MQKLMFSVVLWLVSTCALWADGEAAGDFDYYVLSLSWSPNWCATQGDARGSEQCDADRDLGWVVHGLWPQYEQGWPSYCRSPARMPSRSLTNQQADLFGTSGAAWYQWKKHGICSGLEAQDYYHLVREAFSRVNRPKVFQKLTKPVKLPASVIEEAFLKDNPDWAPDMLTITCKENRIQEARLCLTSDLTPRVCGADVLRDCSAKNALLDPIQ
jgi:ribonuclease T2